MYKLNPKGYFVELASMLPTLQTPHENQLNNQKTKMLFTKKIGQLESRFITNIFHIHNTM